MRRQNKEIIQERRLATKNLFAPQELEYLQQARPNLSISTLPDGPQCYTAMLNANTTFANNAAEIFTWGEEAIAEREAMIRTLGKQLYGSDNLAVIKISLKMAPIIFSKRKSNC